MKVGKLQDSGKEEEGRTLDKFHVVGMNDDFWDKVRTRTILRLYRDSFIFRLRADMMNGHCAKLSIEHKGKYHSNTSKRSHNAPFDVFH